MFGEAQEHGRSGRGNTALGYTIGGCLFPWVLCILVQTRDQKKKGVNFTVSFLSHFCCCVFVMTITELNGERAMKYEPLPLPSTVHHFQLWGHRQLCEAKTETKWHEIKRIKQHLTPLPETKPSHMVWTIQRECALSWGPCVALISSSLHALQFPHESPSDKHRLLSFV